MKEPVVISGKPAAGIVVSELSPYQDDEYGTLRPADIGRNSDNPSAIQGRGHAASQGANGKHKSRMPFRS
jgi:hypothetical protein